MKLEEIRYQLIEDLATISINLQTEFRECVVGTDQELMYLHFMSRLLDLAQVLNNASLKVSLDLGEHDFHDIVRFKDNVVYVTDNEPDEKQFVVILSKPKSSKYSLGPATFILSAFVKEKKFELLPFQLCLRSNDDGVGIEVKPVKILPLNCDMPTETFTSHENEGHPIYGALKYAIAIALLNLGSV